MKRAYLGVSVVTLATLLLELLFTRIFSVTLYYHFAFMVISLALFGLGLSGVMLYLHPERYPEDQLASLLSAYSRRFAVAIVISLLFVVSHAMSTSFDPTKAPKFTWQHILELSYLYLFGAMPFYYGGMTVSLALFHLRRSVATLYFFDLAGASLACLMLDPLLRMFGGPSAVLVVAVLAALAACLFGAELGSWRPERRSFVLAACLLALLLANGRYHFAEVGSVKAVQEENLVFSKWNSLSRVEVQQVGNDRPMLTIDANARTHIHQITDRELDNRYKNASSLAYTIRRNGRVLIIGPGGGVDVVMALRAGHKQVVLAELNPIIIHDVMLGKYRAYSGNLYGQPQVVPNVAEGRSFVRRTRLRYDVIQATLVDTWAATAAGAFSLSENHLYTVEAFVDYLDHLAPDGIVTLSRWVHAPGMEYVRLASLARAALERIGAREPHRHVFAASAGWLGTVLVRRTPFTEKELADLHEISERQGMKIHYSPRGRHSTPTAAILAPGDPSAFYARSPVDLRPVYDDRPYFFYAVKPEAIGAALFGKGPENLNSFATVVLFSLLALVTALVLGGIVVPLWLGKRGALAGSVSSKLRDLAFFLGIGVGYILIEIALLNRFSLYLGHPVHSLRVVLFSLLLFSGVGSLLSGRVKSGRGLLLLMSLSGAGVAGLVALFTVALGPLLHATTPLTFASRVAIAVALVAAPGLLMGTMLPTGIRLVTGRHAEIIPWAWGLNGAASVLGSVMAMVLSVHVGFTATLCLGGAAYLVAVGAGLRRPAS